MPSIWRILSLCVVSASLIIEGCGGSGTRAAGPPGTPTPTPIPTPTPQASAVIWKIALPPVQGGNLLSLVTTGNTVFGAGVKVPPSGNGTNAYAASATDNGTSAAQGTPTSLAEGSDATSMVLINPTTAYAAGSDTPTGSATAVPAAFILNPTSGVFLSVK